MACTTEHNPLFDIINQVAESVAIELSKQEHSRQAFGAPGDRKQTGRHVDIQYNLYETEKTYVVVVNAAGTARETTDLRYDGQHHQLVVSGERKYRDRSGFKHGTFQKGPFELRIPLGSQAAVDADGITAKLHEGVLSVEVPKLRAPQVSIVVS
jgi:HSP20 family molecular chaperone IbpA